MKFHPQKYNIEDKPLHPFISVDEIMALLNPRLVSRSQVMDIIKKSLDKNRLSLEETSILIHATEPDLIEAIKEGARELKKRVYGNRIVLFAPLYVGNKCVNNCAYCGFRVSNKDAVRSTLDKDALITEVQALERTGQKRLILVYGEHPEYNADFIAESVKTVYNTKKKNDEIRRVNINAAPLEIDGFKKVKDAGIGTYQIFQETYHPDAYKKYHKGGKKADYDNRLIALDKAQEAGLDDVGIGALMGLYDWRFEVLSLIRHTNHLEACYNVGPHTISFPRIQKASNVNLNPDFILDDEEFKKMVAILRLAVPYTGLILTAREDLKLREEVINYGVSQIDGGTKIELGAYSNQFEKEQNLNREQFRINDDRSLNEVMEDLIDKQFLPSFCTACYRLGRTGEHFMEFSVPGFIKRFCTPNAILTLAEYLIDYAPESTKLKGWQLIDKEMDDLPVKTKNDLNEKLDRLKNGNRDLYF